MKLHHILLLLLVPVLANAQEYTRVPGLPTSLALVSERSNGLTAAVAQGLYLRQEPDSVFRLVGNTGGPSRSSGSHIPTGVGISPDGRYAFVSAYRAEGIYRYDIVERVWMNVSPPQLPLGLRGNVTAMAVHPVSGSILAGGGRFEASGSPSAAIGLFLSSDNGETWSSVTSPDGSNGSWGHISAIQPDSAGSFIVSVFSSNNGQQLGLYRVRADASAYQLARETPKDFVVTRSGAYHLPFPDLIRYVPFSGPDSGTAMTKRDLQGVEHLARWSADSVIAILKNATGRGYWFTFISRGEHLGPLRPFMDSIDNTGEFTWFSSRQGEDLDIIRIGQGVEHETRVNGTHRRLRFEPSQPLIFDAVARTHQVLLKISGHGWFSLLPNDDLAFLRDLKTSSQYIDVQRVGDQAPVFLQPPVAVRVLPNQTIDTILHLDALPGGPYTFAPVAPDSGACFVRSGDSLFRYDLATQQLQPIAMTGWPRREDSSLLPGSPYLEVGRTLIAWVFIPAAKPETGGWYQYREGAWERQPRDTYQEGTVLRCLCVDGDSLIAATTRVISSYAVSTVVSSWRFGDTATTVLSQDGEAEPGVSSVAWLHSGQPAWSDLDGRLWIRFTDARADSTTLFGKVISISPESSRTTLVTQDSGVYRVTAFRVPTSVPDDAPPLVEQITPCMFTGGQAIIYNALGEQVAILTVIDDALAPSDLEALPMQPLWAVSGECVRRVR